KNPSANRPTGQPANRQPARCRVRPYWIKATALRAGCAAWRPVPPPTRRAGVRINTDPERAIASGITCPLKLLDQPLNVGRRVGEEVNHRVQLRIRRDELVRSKVHANIHLVVAFGLPAPYEALPSYRRARLQLRNPWAPEDPECQSCPPL